MGCCFSSPKSLPHVCLPTPPAALKPIRVHSHNFHEPIVYTAPEVENRHRSRRGSIEAIVPLAISYPANTMKQLPPQKSTN